MAIPLAQDFLSNRLRIQLDIVLKKLTKKRLENIIKIECLSPPACHLSQATIFFDF